MLKNFGGLSPVIAIKPWQASSTEVPTMEEIREFEELCFEVNLMRRYAPNISGWPVRIRGNALPPLTENGFYLPAMAVPTALNLLEDLMKQLLAYLPAVGWQPDNLPSQLDLDFLRSAQIPGRREDMKKQLNLLDAAMSRIALGMGIPDTEGSIDIAFVTSDGIVNTPTCLILPVTRTLYRLCELFYVAGEEFQAQKTEEYQACL